MSCIRAYMKPMYCDVRLFWYTNHNHVDMMTRMKAATPTLTNAMYRRVVSKRVEDGDGEGADDPEDSSQLRISGGQSNT